MSYYVFTPYQQYCIDKIRNFYGDDLPENSDADIIDFALGCMCSDITRLEKERNENE